MALRVGIIGGTGLYSLGAGEPIEVETPHGAIVLHRSNLANRETFFLPRHGPHHESPAHRINHHANIQALASAHCGYVVAINSVGSLLRAIRPGAWVVPDDFLDRHRTVPPTFYHDRAVHVDFSDPYCPTVRKTLKATHRPPLRGVVYAGVDGPRFETPAEVQTLARAGAGVVGMTGVPEAVLARERGLCHASLAFVGNYATGIGGRVQAQAIQRGLERQAPTVRRLLEKTVRALPQKKTCRCAEATRFAEISGAGQKR